MKKQLLAFGRVVGIAISISVMILSGPVSAIKPEYVEQFSHNKIWAYNPDDDNCTPSKMPSGKEITYIGDSLGESILDLADESVKFFLTVFDQSGNIRYRGISKFHRYHNEELGFTAYATMQTNNTKIHVIITPWVNVRLCVYALDYLVRLPLYAL